MMNKIKIAALGAITLAICANPVFADKHLLKHNGEVFSRLKNIAIGDEIRNNCDSIVANENRVKRYLVGIVFYAGLRGFSQIEMLAYRDDVVEQKRLLTAAYEYLDANGVDREAETGYCALGQKEIAGKSKIGKMLING